MQATACPECGRPAEVVDRFLLESTDGPVEHVQVRCIAKHWFMLPTSDLQRAQPPRPPETTRTRRTATRRPG